MKYVPLAASGLLCTLLAVTCAEAQSPTTPAVEVRVGAVLASNRGDEVDRRLASMRRQFDSFFSYSSYRLIDQQERHIAWGEKAEFDVPGGRNVQVTPREFRNESIVMKVVVSDGQRAVVDTLVALRDHGTFLVGGQRQQDGVMIVAIGASRTEPR